MLSKYLIAEHPHPQPLFSLLYRVSLSGPAVLELTLYCTLGWPWSLESLRNCDYRHVSTKPVLGHPLKVLLPDITTQVRTHEPLKGTPCLKYISVCLLSLCRWITLSGFFGWCGNYGWPSFWCCFCLRSRNEKLCWWSLYSFGRRKSQHRYTSPLLFQGIALMDQSRSQGLDCWSTQGPPWSHTTWQLTFHVASFGQSLATT